MGLSRVPLLCAREIPVPGRAAARHPRADPLLRRRSATSRSTSTSARRASCGSTSKAPNRLRPMALEFAEQGPPHPGLPGRRRLRAPRAPSPSSPPTSRRTRRSRRWSRRPRRRSPALNRYPDPTNAALRTRARRPLRRARAAGSRSATARATSCSPPATRCSSRAPSSSTPGRRSRSTRTWPPPPARARSRSRSTPSTATTSRRCAREITVATRLVIVCNPNNPTSTALPLDEIAAFVRRRPAPRRA